MANHSIPAPPPRVTSSPTIGVATFKQRQSIPAPVSVVIGIQLAVEWPYQPLNPVSLGAPGHILMAEPLVLGSPGGSLIEWSRSPLVWLINAARLDDHKKNFGKKWQEATFTNYNDKISIDIDSGSLVGRTDAKRGPAQRINIIAPLKLDHLKLHLDESGLRKLIADEVEARVKAVLDEAVARDAADAAIIANQNVIFSRLGVLPTKFILAGSFSVPILTPNCRIHLVGGGGGSGTGGYQGGGTCCPVVTILGAHGGDGGYCTRLLSGLTMGLTLTLVVGVGGIRGNGSTLPLSTGGVGASTILSSGTQACPTLFAGGGTGGESSYSRASPLFREEKPGFTGPSSLSDFPFANPFLGFGAGGVDIGQGNKPGGDGFAMFEWLP